ncbi:hypothetical protein YTPLAS21_06940 [Candidatus Nitrosocosmicus sp.]|jgi:hypothetical protein|uniref:hypothetical protein n=1 Tax=Candidatus Nitrosocosmicus sp. FF01 TaxID=3397670 RepID=UPI002ACC9007|nr:hypothetical protein YTPLAS21_06940 [Candidatus Nitrosocosmicus sp.]
MNFTKKTVTNLFLFSLLSIVMIWGTLTVLPSVHAQAANNVTSSGTGEPETPLEFISVIRGLLNQTVIEYTNQNYTGAEELATTAYLDNYEYVEGRLAEIDRPLMETTEIQMREELRKMILDRVPVEELQDHIDEINANLDKSVELLSNSTA